MPLEQTPGTNNFSNATHPATSFEDLGYVVIPNLLSPIELETLKQKFTEISAARKQRKLSPYATVLGVHKEDPFFQDFASLPSLTEYAKNLLGGRVSILHTVVFFKPPGSGRCPPHQDNYYNRVIPHRGVVTCWIAIDSVEKENGGLFLYPRSHKLPILKAKKAWIKLIANSPQIVSVLLKSKFDRNKYKNVGQLTDYIKTEVPNHLVRKDASFKPGTAVFFHGNLLHGSHANASTTQFRRAIAIVYLKEGVQFKKGLFANRKPMIPK